MTRPTTIPTPAAAPQAMQVERPVALRYWTLDSRCPGCKRLYCACDHSLSGRH